jgi:hypothetical protein
MKGKAMSSKKFFTLFTPMLFMIIFSCPAVVSACSGGDRAEVLWKGTWYPAHVLKGKGSECYIHYDGYGSNWDEWVGPDRIKIASRSFYEGDSVQVLWKGNWWPAHVLKAKGGLWKIHYDGYDSSWDEWVGLERLRS